MMEQKQEKTQQVTRARDTFLIAVGALLGFIIARFLIFMELI